MEKDTVLGKTEKAAGHIKETAGKLPGDKHLQAEGVEGQAKGQVQAIIGAIKQVGKTFPPVRETEQRQRSGIPSSFSGQKA